MFPELQNLSQARKKAKSKQFELRLAFPPERVWEMIFDLNALHFSMGVPAETRKFFQHKLGLSQVSSALWGPLQTYWEFPLSWDYLRFYRLERLAPRQNLSYLAWQFDFKPAAGETLLQVKLSYLLQPPSPAFEKKFEIYLSALNKQILLTLNLQEASEAKYPALPAVPSLSQKAARLSLHLANHQEAVHPLMLETETGLTREQILSALIEYSYLGLYAPFWRVLEPDGTLLTELKAPTKLPTEYPSQKYGQNYKIQPDIHLSLWFRKPETESPSPSPFPRSQKQRLAQFWLGPGETHSLTPQSLGALRIASPSLSGHLHLRIAPRGAEEVTIQVKDRLEDSEWPILALDGRLKLQCLVPEGAVFYAYLPYAPQEGLSAAQAMSSENLKYLLPELELLSGDTWRISQEVFLALGFPPNEGPSARDQTTLLQEICLKFCGRMLKPPPENALMIFPWAESGLQAALQILKQIKAWNLLLKPEKKLQVTMALHRGGADFSPQGSALQASGPGLRTTLQLLEQAKPNQLVFSRTLMMDPEFQTALQKSEDITLYELHRFIRARSQEPDRIYALLLKPGAD